MTGTESIAAVMRTATRAFMVVLMPVLMLLPLLVPTSGPMLVPMRLPTPAPVSYTHLDVYKRQETGYWFADFVAFG